jgi:spermidine synthase
MRPRASRQRRRDIQPSLKVSLQKSQPIDAEASRHGHLRDLHDGCEHRAVGAAVEPACRNTTFHFRPNTTNLLSAEYLELLKPLLRDDGILVYNTTSSLRVQRTGCLAFGNGMRVLNALAVSKRPLRLDHARLRAALAEQQIDGRRLFDLSQQDDRARLDTIVDELTPGSSARWDNLPTTETCEAIVARTAALRTVTDDNMGDEW